VLTADWALTLFNLSFVPDAAGKKTSVDGGGF
jgi:hypothetical protein